MRRRCPACNEPPGLYEFCRRCTRTAERYAGAHIKLELDPFNREGYRRFAIRVTWKSYGAFSAWPALYDKEWRGKLPDPNVAGSSLWQVAKLGELPRFTLSEAASAEAVKVDTVAFRRYKTEYRDESGNRVRAFQWRQVGRAYPCFGECGRKTPEDFCRECLKRLTR